MKKIFYLSALGLALSLAFFVSGNVLAVTNSLINPITTPKLNYKFSDNNLAQVKAPTAVIANLKTLEEKGLGFMADVDTGRLKALNVDTAPIVLTAKVSTPVDAGKQFLKDYGANFNLAKADTKVDLPIIQTDGEITHLYYPRLYNNIPVIGSSFLVHTRGAEILSATANVLNDDYISTTPSISLIKARVLAEGYGRTKFKMTDPWSESPRLVIFNQKYFSKQADSKNILAYQVRVNDKKDATLSQEMYIDAITGAFLYSYDTTMFSQYRQIYNCLDEQDPCTDNEDLSDEYSGRFENDTEVRENMINIIYDNFANPYKYYLDKFKLDGANGKGGITKGMGSLDSKTPVDALYRIFNDDQRDRIGFYNSQTGITITDSKSNFKVPFVRGVINHEYSHAMAINQVIKLFPMQRETAVLNEAYAEIFAVFIKQYFDELGYDYDDGLGPWARLGGKDFVFSNDTWAPLTHYDVNFSGKYSDRHTNAFVLEHLVYLLSEGGTLDSCRIDAVGKATMEKVLFKSLKYLPDNAEFPEFYIAVKSACKNEKFSQAVCDKIAYAMRVAQVDHPGAYYDPNWTQNDGRPCDSDGNPLIGKPDSYYCNKFGYNCNDVNITDEDTLKIRKINCGTCYSGKICTNNRCTTCKPESDVEMCAKVNRECHIYPVVDRCGQYKVAKCGDCPSTKSCNKSIGKCIVNKLQKGANGYYDSAGIINQTNGGYYKAITIGNTSVLKDNYNGGSEQKLGTIQQDNQKSCLDNKSGNCWNYGGLYQWHTAMGLPAECDTKDCGSMIKNINHQGICPTGWHVPSDNELAQFEDQDVRSSQGASCDPRRIGKYDCADAGGQMRLLGDDKFSAKIFSGYSAGKYIDSVHYLSATQAKSKMVYARELRSVLGPNDKVEKNSLQGATNYNIGRTMKNKNEYFALRCFADCTYRNGEWDKTWYPIGGCGEVKAGVQMEYRKCINRECGGEDCEGSATREKPCDQNSCGGLFKYEGGPYDMYGAKPASGLGGYYRTAVAYDKCWLADDLNVNKTIVTDKIIPTYDWATYTDQKELVKQDNIVLDHRLSDYEPKRYPVGSVKRGICPPGWRIPTINDWLLSPDEKKAINLANTEYWALEGFVGQYQWWSPAVYLKEGAKNDYAPVNYLYGYLNRDNNAMNPKYAGNFYDHYSNKYPVRCIREVCTPAPDWSKLNNPFYNPYSSASEPAYKRISDTLDLRKELELYKTDKGSYPELLVPKIDFSKLQGPFYFLKIPEGITFKSLIPTKSLNVTSFGSYQINFTLPSGLCYGGTTEYIATPTYIGPAVIMTSPPVDTPPDDPSPVGPGPAKSTPKTPTGLNSDQLKRLSE